MLSGGIRKGARSSSVALWAAAERISFLSASDEHLPAFLPSTKFHDLLSYHIVHVLFRYNRKCFTMADVNEVCTFKKKAKLSQRTRKRKSTSDEGIM